MAIDGLNNAAERLDAVRAGNLGGGKLTTESQVLAQQNYGMAWLNVGLALVDAGLTARAAFGLLRAPQTVQTLSRLKLTQLDQFTEARALIQNGKARQAEPLLQNLRGTMSPEEFKRIEALLNNPTTNTGAKPKPEGAKPKPGSPQERVSVPRRTPQPQATPEPQGPKPKPTSAPDIP
jgi:hypothetical protein